MYTLSSLSPRKKAFLFSTLLLTASGFICRVLGFFYRIFLSRTIGAEGLGIYHMVHPVFGICFSLCAGSIQTALSQLIASRTADGKRIFHRGIVLSMGMSLILSALICRYSDFLARYVLMAPECAPYLPVMGISVPFAAFHACINGYYYGVQKSRVPAFSQIAEQVIRMTLVFFLASSMIAAGKEITVELAVTGHLIGEIASALFTFLCLIFIPPQRTSPSAPAQTPAASISLPLLTLAFPLMGNRLVLNILASAEAVWIPNCLQRFGLSSVEAFSVYGVLTGMALPFILFPSAITNSMAVLLLPNVAQAQSEGKQERISSCIAMSLRTVCIWEFSVLVFLFYLALPWETAYSMIPQQDVLSGFWHGSVRFSICPPPQAVFSMGLAAPAPPSCTIPPLSFFAFALSYLEFPDSVF